MHDGQEDEDLAIVARAQRDPAAFAPLYQRYEPIVRGYCQRRLGDPEVAADATSRVFIRVLQALPNFRPDPSRSGSTFRSWLSPLPTTSWWIPTAAIENTHHSTNPVVTDNRTRNPSP